MKKDDEGRFNMGIDVARKLRKTSTISEIKLWQYLRNNRFMGLKFRRQYSVSKYVVDFICLSQNLVIELYGGRHSVQLDYDNNRTKYLEHFGLRVLRLWNHDVLTRFKIVLEQIRLNMVKGIMCATTVIAEIQSFFLTNKQTTAVLNKIIYLKIKAKYIMINKTLFVMFFLGLIFSSNGLLISCANNKIFMKSPVNMPSDDANIKLAEAASSISNSMMEIAKIEKVITPPPRDNILTIPNSSTLQTRASVDWSGPIQELTNKISNAAQYRLRILGKEPAVPILISINKQDESLAEILRDVDYQAGTRANIHVYPHSQIIELRYAKIYS